MFVIKDQDGRFHCVQDTESLHVVDPTREGGLRGEADASDGFPALVCKHRSEGGLGRLYKATTKGSPGIKECQAVADKIILVFGSSFPYADVTEAACPIATATPLPWALGSRLPIDLPDVVVYDTKANVLEIGVITVRNEYVTDFAINNPPADWISLFLFSIFFAVPIFHWDSMNQVSSDIKRIGGMIAMLQLQPRS